MSNMADAAAARREARRRKILENSHNRLSIISGKSSDECVKESPIIPVIPEPDYEFAASISASNHSTSQQNGILFNPPAELFQFLSTTHDIDASGDGEVHSDLASLLPSSGLGLPTSEPVEVPTLSFWEKITIYKYDIVILSLLLQILYKFSLFTFESGYFFLPVLVYIVTKLIWFPTQSSSNLANMLLLLNGMSPARTRRIIQLSQCFGVISRDIFVYIFTTVCIQSLCVALKNSLVV